MTQLDFLPLSSAHSSSPLHFLHVLFLTFAFGFPARSHSQQPSLKRSCRCPMGSRAALTSVLKLETRKLPQKTKQTKKTMGDAAIWDVFFKSSPPILTPRAGPLSRRSTGSLLPEPGGSRRRRGSHQVHRQRPRAGAQSCCSGSVTLLLLLLQYPGHCGRGRGERWARRRCWRRAAHRVGALRAL